MRRGFTLIEVLVAVLIASISAAALLQTNSMNLRFFEHMRSAAYSAEIATIVGNHADTRFKHTTKSFYDFLDGAYDIQNDALRRRLKDERFDYTERVVDTVIFGAQENADAEPSPNFDDTDDTVPAGGPLIQFEIVRASIKGKHQSASVLQIRPL